MRGTVVDVSVRRDDGAGLAVAWTIDGDPVAAEVATGPPPHAINHEHALTVQADEQTARVDPVADGRTYVSVSPTDGGSAVVAAERLLPFEGANNVRDLGGYRTRDGRRVRWGQVFRSDSLHGLTPSDVALCET